MSAKPEVSVVLTQRAKHTLYLLWNKATSGSVPRGNEVLFMSLDAAKVLKQVETIEKTAKGSWITREDHPGQAAGCARCARHTAGDEGAT